MYVDCWRINWTQIFALFEEQGEWPINVSHIYYLIRSIKFWPLAFRPRLSNGVEPFGRDNVPISTGSYKTKLTLETFPSLPYNILFHLSSEAWEDFYMIGFWFSRNLIFLNVCRRLRHLQFFLNTKTDTLVTN